MKNSRGITLLALIVTVIVLIILASISISAITGNNSLINQAIKSKDETGIAEEKELVEKCVAYAKAKHKYGSLTKTDLEDQLEIYTQDRTYVDPESDNPIKVTFTDSGRNYFVDVDGNVTKQRAYSDEVKASLTEGKYVTYKEQPYRVLYDVNSGYDWIELVSVYSFDKITIGKSDPTVPVEEEGYDFAGSNSQFEKARWSFNNYIKTLDTKAQEYLTDLADRSRCIGSNPVNPSLDTDTMFNDNNNHTYFREWNNKFKDKVAYSTTDETQLAKIDAKESDNYGYNLDGYFLASHTANINGTKASFSIRMSYRAGFISYVLLCQVNKYQQYTAENITKGFRPVVRLKESIKIKGGSGSIDSPYTIGL